MTMIKCPECRHHISSMAKACPECGCPIDPEWAEAEAKREQESLDEVPFTVETGVEEEAPSAIETGVEDGDSPSALETGVEEQTHLNPPLKGGGEEDSTDDTPRSLREGMGESPESPKSPERPETPAAAPKRSSAGGMFIGLVVSPHRRSLLLRLLHQPEARATCLRTPAGLFESCLLRGLHGALSQERIHRRRERALC